MDLDFQMSWSKALCSITTLLAERQVQLLEISPQQNDLDLLLTWQRLWAEFSAYMELRDFLIREGKQRPFVPRSTCASSLAAHLVSVGLLRFSRGTYCVVSSKADRLLRGAWLEELGAMIARNAGADEVRHSQQIRWKSRYSDESMYQNEIDVLARFGDRIAFVSCKALPLFSSETSAGAERIFDAMKEVAYWLQHFGAGRGHAILLTTADFIDEARRRPRNAALLEHAAILGVTLVSADTGDARSLAAAFRDLMSPTSRRPVLGKGVGCYEELRTF